MKSGRSFVVDNTNPTRRTERSISGLRGKMVIVFKVITFSPPSPIVLQGIESGRGKSE